MPPPQSNAISQPLPPTQPNIMSHPPPPSQSSIIRPLPLPLTHINGFAAPAHMNYMYSSTPMYSTTNDMPMYDHGTHITGQSNYTPCINQPNFHGSSGNGPTSSQYH